MADYIDRDALLRDIEHYCVSDGKMQHWVQVQPAAAVAPVKHGQWKQVSKANRAVKCTACGFTTDSARARMYRYCPDCGAKMDGGKDNA